MRFIVILLESSMMEDKEIELNITEECFIIISMGFIQL